MKNLLLPLFAFLLGFGGAFGFQFIRMQQVGTKEIASPITNQPAPEPTLALRPPSEALSGILTLISGHTQKFSRGETEYKEASTGAEILLGESIATNANSSATAEVAGIVKVNFGPMAELVFANMFPENFLLQQKNGKIEYVATRPISVRALHALVSMEPASPAGGPGNVVITIIDTDISVTVKSGSVKLAVVDTDNNTRVYTLTTGQRANVDDEAREVLLIKSR